MPSKIGFCETVYMRIRQGNFDENHFLKNKNACWEFFQCTFFCENVFCFVKIELISKIYSIFYEGWTHAKLHAVHSTLVIRGTNGYAKMLKEYKNYIPSCVEWKKFRGEKNCIITSSTKIIEKKLKKDSKKCLSQAMCEIEWFFFFSCVVLINFGFAELEIWKKSDTPTSLCSFVTFWKMCI